MHFAKEYVFCVITRPYKITGENNTFYSRKRGICNVLKVKSSKLQKKIIRNFVFTA